MPSLALVETSFADFFGYSIIGWLRKQGTCCHSETSLTSSGAAPHVIMSVMFTWPGNQHQPSSDSAFSISQNLLAKKVSMNCLYEYPSIVWLSSRWDLCAIPHLAVLFNVFLSWVAKTSPQMSALNCSPFWFSGMRFALDSTNLTWMPCSVSHLR